MPDENLSPLAQQVLARIDAVERRQRVLKATCAAAIVTGGLLFPALLREGDEPTPLVPSEELAGAETLVARDLPQPDEAVLDAFEAGGGAAALESVKRLFAEGVLEESLLGLDTGGFERYLDNAPWEQRLAVLDAIVRSPPDVRARLAGVVLAGLEDENVEVRSVALQTLTHCFPNDRSHDVLDRIIIDRARDGSEPERWRATGLLDQPRFRHLAFLLREGLRDDAARVRARAAACVGRAGARELVEDVRPLLDDPDRNALAQAAKALALLGDPAGNAALRALLGDPDLSTQITAMGYLVDVGDPLGVATAKEFVASGDVRKQRQAFRVLGDAREPVEPRTIDEALASDEPLLRIFAGRLLLLTGSDRGAEVLRGYLDEPRFGNLAARYLLEADAPRFAPEVRALMERVGAVERRALSELLREDEPP